METAVPDAAAGPAASTGSEPTVPSTGGSSAPPAPLVPQRTADPGEDDDRTPAIAAAILDFIGQVPGTKEHAHHSPLGRARRIGNLASARAAFAAGTLSLPPGVLGWLTIVPEIRAVWQQQAQMVADIAGAYGRHHELSREVMLYCLFRHIAPAAFRALVRREGDTHVIGRATAPVFAAIAGKIATRVSLRLVGRGASRWLPVVGAVGNGGFAWLDTGRVANTAIELFSHPLVVAGAAHRPPRPR